jgi:hypothetical protein
MCVRIRNLHTVKLRGTRVLCVESWDAGQFWSVLAFAVHALSHRGAICCTHRATHGRTHHDPNGNTNSDTNKVANRGADAPAHHIPDGCADSNTHIPHIRANLDITHSHANITPIDGPNSCTDFCAICRTDWRTVCSHGIWQRWWRRKLGDRNRCWAGACLRCHWRDPFCACAATARRSAEGTVI